MRAHLSLFYKLQLAAQVGCDCGLICSSSGIHQIPLSMFCLPPEKFFYSIRALFLGWRFAAPAPPPQR